MAVMAVMAVTPHCRGSLGCHCRAAEALQLSSPDVVCSPGHGDPVVDQAVIACDLGGLGALGGGLGGGLGGRLVSLVSLVSLVTID